MDPLRTLSSKPPPPPGMPLWSLGFRPFFLGAALAAVLLMAGWLWMLAGGAAPPHYGAIGWHGHEMVFGYAVAVIAGFLLVGVRNWTGLPTPTGGRLAALFLLWLAGRLAPLAALPGPLVAALDLAFLPALMAALARPLSRGEPFPNRSILPLLGLLTLANALAHAEALGVVRGSLGPALGLGLMVLLIALVAGWAFPLFTGRALAGARAPLPPWRERAALGALGAWALGQAGLPDMVLGPLALAAAALHGARMGGWWRPGVGRVPLLWVLFGGYGWLVAGLALDGLARLGLVPPGAAVHALAAGALGTLTLGMMARVSLGHTGRPMVAAAPVVAAFALANLAALARLWAAFWPGAGMTVLAGGLWIAAFALFLWVYGPVWAGPGDGSG
ncbi:MAG: NnrS family protein [Nitrospirae bacterium]|nr:NnrS family protein [Nitrospirota bacterium]